MPLDLRAPDAEQLQQCLDRIDDAAEKARARYMTIMRAQQAEYDAKYAEATNALNNLTGSYPMIEAEAQARGITKQAMAKLIRDRRKRCDEIIAAIAKIRSPAKARAKSTPADAPAIASRAETDLAAI